MVLPYFSDGLILRAMRGSDRPKQVLLKEKKMSAAPDPRHLQHPPSGLLAFASLFLDFDGTLVEIAEEPDAVIVDPGLAILLANLARSQGNRLALVSGRSIATLDALLGTITHMITVSGSHGAECRSFGVLTQPERPAALDAVEQQLRDVAAAHTGVLVEPKSFGVALHYRLAPAFAAQAQWLADELGRENGLTVQRGKMVVEVLVRGHDKGTAIAALMQRPEFSGSPPVFIGDDVTDECGFAAVEAIGGAGILVGPPRDTMARYRLPDPASVRAWLAGAIA